MARIADLITFARHHGLKIISVADIVAHRRLSEQLVTRESSVNLPTRHGDFRLHLYLSHLDNQHHLALVLGDPAASRAPLVRLHSECLTGDVFRSLRCDCGSQLDKALSLVAEEGQGIIVYMRQEGRGIGLSQKMHAYALQESGLDTVEANHQLGFAADLRDYGLSAQILKDLGVQRIRLLTNNPDKVVGLERYGLEVEERLPLILPSTEHNEHYLATKKSKLGHLL